MPAIKGNILMASWGGEVKLAVKVWENRWVLDGLEMRKERESTSGSWYRR